MASRFWANKIKEGKPVKVENSADTLISITQAALVGGNEKKRTVLSLVVDGTEFACCSLTSSLPQFKLDLCVEPEQEIQFSVKGPGEIHLLGYSADLQDDGDMLANEMEYDSEEELEEEEGSEEEDQPTLPKRNGAALKVPQPAKKQKTEEPKNQPQQTQSQQKQQAPKTPQPQGKDQKTKSPQNQQKPQTPGGKPQTPGAKPQTPGAKVQTPAGKPQTPGAKVQTPGGKPNQGGKKKN